MPVYRVDSTAIANKYLLHSQYYRISKHNKIKTMMIVFARVHLIYKFSNMGWSNRMEAGHYLNSSYWSKSFHPPCWFVAMIRKARSEKTRANPLKAKEPLLTKSSLLQRLKMDGTPNPYPDACAGASAARGGGGDARSCFCGVVPSGIDIFACGGFGLKKSLSQHESLISIWYDVAWDRRRPDGDCQLGRGEKLLACGP